MDRSCVKVEVVIMGFPSLLSLMVSVDVKQQLKTKKKMATQSCGPEHVSTHSDSRRKLNLAVRL